MLVARQCTDIVLVSAFPDAMPTRCLRGPAPVAFPLRTATGLPLGQTAVPQLQVPQGSLYDGRGKNR